MVIVDKLKVEAIIICDLVPKGASFSSADISRLDVKVEDPEIPQKILRTEGPSWKIISQNT